MIALDQHFDLMLAKADLLEHRLWEPDADAMAPFLQRYGHGPSIIRSAHT
jgi:hypothetical protein